MQHPYFAFTAPNQCGLGNKEIGYRDPAGVWHACFESEIGDEMEHKDGKSYRCVEVVLTVMHLNHQPEDCGDENLLHACQGCHNRYDAPQRRAGIQARARAVKAVGDLFP